MACVSLWHKKMSAPPLHGRHAVCLATGANVPGKTHRGAEAALQGQTCSHGSSVFCSLGSM